MRWAIYLLACFLASGDPLKLAEPYQSLLDLAQTTPSEFSSDGLLRIVETGKITDRDARRTLIEDAFRTAQAAKFPMKMRAIAGTTLDTRTGILAQAYDLNLDALSLQSRAVKDLLGIDSAAALAMFEEIPPPSLAPLSCNDALVYDPSAYYETLGLVVNRSFPTAARTKEEHINLLLGALSRATSPLQLAPIAEVIRSANVTPAQRELLWSRYSGMLEYNQADGRSYVASIDPLSRATGSEAADAFQKFRQRGTGCPGDASRGVEVQTRSRTVQAGSTPVVHPYWQSTEAKQMLEDGKKLRFDSTGHQLSDADRATPEWRQRLADYLSALAHWEPASEDSEADYYHEKSVVYLALIELIPAGGDRDQALNACIDFMNGSSLAQQSPVEWYLEAKLLLERSRQSSGGEPGKVLEAFEHSGNPVLQLELAFDKATGSPMPSWAHPQN